MKTKKWIYNYFTEDELTEIQSALDDVERNSSGEIVLSLRNKRTFMEKLYTQHELAWKDFNRLGVADTRERTGILVFILFEEKYYDIIADEGINKKIPNDLWNEVETNLKEEFRKPNYSKGLLMLIEKMKEILRREFPCRAETDNDDEIMDEIVVN